MDGGTLYIGVNDDGYVVGIEESRKLLEALPNKISDKLGIIASINIYHAEGQGINIKYRDSVPHNIENKLVNMYARGVLNSRIVEESTDLEIKKYKKAIMTLEEENPIHITHGGGENWNISV